MTTRRQMNIGTKRFWEIDDIGNVLEALEKSLQELAA
jgi:hypothetical protein